MRRHSDPSPLSFPPGSPLSFPQGSPLSFPQGFSGNPWACSSGPLFGGPRVGKTHGFPIKDVGNDSGGDYQRWNDSGGIWGASVSLLSFPQGSSLSFPPVSPLSFPQGFSGNPWACSSVPSFGGPRLGKAYGFPIKDVGNDGGGDYQRWNDSGGIWGASVSLLSFPQVSPLSFPQGSPLSFSQVSPLSFPPGFSGNPWACSSVLSFGRACLGEPRGFPIKDVGHDGGGKMSGMTGCGLKMAGMTEGD